MFNLQQEKEECRRAVEIVRYKVHSKLKKTNIDDINQNYTFNHIFIFQSADQQKRDQLHPRPTTLQSPGLSALHNSERYRPLITVMIHSISDNLIYSRIFGENYR